MNIPQNIFVGQAVNTLQGPVVSSQTYDERTLTYLDVYEWEIHNGAKLTAPLPFGLFAEIVQLNMNKSKLRLKMAPGYLANAPVFEEVTGKAKNFSKYLRDALIIRKVVPSGFDIASVTETDFWDIRLEPIDTTHSMLVKIYALTPPVTGYETLRDLNVPSKFTEEIIPSSEVPENSTDPNIEYTPVDVFHTLKRTGIIPTAALNAFQLSFPTRFNLNLPPVLKTVNVIWNDQFSEGTQTTSAYDIAVGDSGQVSLSIPDSASSAAAITAELQITFEEFATNNLYTQTYVFYMPPPITQATILAKLTALTGVSVLMWPVFKPKSETLVITGQSVSIRANVQVSLNSSWSSSGASWGKSQSISDDYSIGITNNTIQTPPCIHELVTLTGGTSKTKDISAVASMDLTSSNGQNVSATITKEATAYGTVTPSSLPATSGQNTIPTSGLYLMDIDVAPYDYGWFKVRAEVFNANALA